MPTHRHTELPELQVCLTWKKACRQGQTASGGGQEGEQDSRAGKSSSPWALPTGRVNKILGTWGSALFCLDLLINPDNRKSSSQREAQKDKKQWGGGARASHMGGKGSSTELRPKPQQVN